MWKAQDASGVSYFWELYSSLKPTHSFRELHNEDNALRRKPSAFRLLCTTLYLAIVIVLWLAQHLCCPGVAFEHPAAAYDTFPTRRLCTRLAVQEQLAALARHEVRLDRALPRSQFSALAAADRSFLPSETNGYSGRQGLWAAAGKQTEGHLNKSGVG